MTTLTLVRHGQTDWNLARRIQGATDVPLNDTGRGQARDAAAALRPDLAPDSTVVVASDLSRARETAEIIAAELGLDAPRLYPELRERAYGEAEGVLVEEFPERFGGWDRDSIPGAESRTELRRRGVRAVRRVARDVRRDTAPTAVSVIAVSHGALIGELIRHASGDTLPLPGERLDNGSLHRFVIERESIRLLRYAGAVV
ncbi:MAG TPA: histidine phosphatase family protein [Microbacterium sp.]|uniref:histidine phosphatase family protein n=1 Tax=Microbacterium sp. TaxID=51671 RepID=UPI002C3C9219|nr:histidine phosphatase family protein [Microbacterium sp.]HWI32416.1 histidine phosphatase family protein [Microbacterium sp.]